MEIESYLESHFDSCDRDDKFDNSVVVSINHKTFGPVDIAQIEVLTQKFPESMTLVLFREDPQLPWSMLAEHSHFNRRSSPGLNSQSILESNEFYVLKNGIKIGPYRFENVETLMASRELVYTDLISLDNGAHWVHLYQLERFDRRSQDSEDLPHLPALEIFDQSEIDAHENKHERQVDEEISQMRGLIQKDPTEKKVSTQTESSKSQFNLKYAVGGLVAFLIVGLWFGTGTKSKREPTSIREEIQKTVEQSLNDEQATDEKPKSKRAFERRPPTTSRKPRQESFTKSNAYREVQDRLGEVRENNNEETYTDEETDPYEYDPVQSKVSKETMDRFENQDETIDDLDRAPASDDSAPWPAAEEGAPASTDAQAPMIEEAEVIDF
ncbi:MAG: hypothetical protein Fur0010_22160 [Bdellovibrio sp.]